MARDESEIMTASLLFFLHLSSSSSSDLIKRVAIELIFSISLIKKTAHEYLPSRFWSDDFVIDISNADWA